MYSLKEIYKIEINETGKFLERPNRFICEAELSDGRKVTAHVHDSGRIKELLYKGNTISLRKAKDISSRRLFIPFVCRSADNPKAQYPPYLGRRYAWNDYSYCGSGGYLYALP